MVQVYLNQAFDALLGVIYDAPPMAKLLSVIKNQIMCQTLAFAADNAFACYSCVAHSLPLSPFWEKKILCLFNRQFAKGTKRMHFKDSVINPVMFKD
jgi:hypothetical protein